MGGWRKFVPVSGGDGTKKSPSGDIFDQTPGEMISIRRKLVNQVGDYVVLSPEGAVLVASTETESSDLPPPNLLNDSISSSGCFSFLAAVIPVHESVLAQAKPCPINFRSGHQASLKKRRSGFSSFFIHPNEKGRKGNFSTAAFLQPQSVPRAVNLRILLAVSTALFIHRCLRLRLRRIGVIIRAL